jgi:Domain of unknown function (DUF4350)
VSGRRFVIGVVLVLIALNVASRAVETVFPEPGGPASSAYATSEDGFAAYAELLRRAGHDVDRARELPRELELAPGETTVVLADAGLVENADAEALGRYVDAGGRLVAVGPALGWLHHVTESPPEWSEGPVQSVRLLAPRAELAQVRRLAGLTGGSWASAGGTLPLLGDDDSSLLTVLRADHREAFFLADSAPLRNETLAAADNAALALALAGSPARRVVFLESYHGFGEERGFWAIPDSWLVTLGGMLVAALAFMVARGRRLGPPEEPARELAPPRRLFVESLGTLLARTRRPAEAVAPLQARALETAELLGLPDEERRALEAEPRNGAELLRYGRAAAALERRARRFR